jgi:signal transduction histidine kinase/ActR/RegA family two-component response regulator
MQSVAYGMATRPPPASGPKPPARIGRRSGRASDSSGFPEALAALGRLATGGERIESLLASGCGLVAGALSADAAVLFEPAVTADRLVVRAGAGLLGATAGEQVACGPGAEPGFTLWPDRTFAGRHGLDGEALAVLPGPSGPLGLLGAYQAAARAFVPDELAFLEAAATWLSAALDRHRSGLLRDRLYAQLAAAERTASLGTLAGGVAHELNNPLSYVTANLTFIAEEGEALARRLESERERDPTLLRSAQELVDAAADARDGVEQMRGLVRDLLTLARGDDSVLAPIDLTHVLVSSINVALSEIRHRARVERELAESLPPVRANAARLGQVFLNLLIDAARAIPEGQGNDHLIRVRSFTLPGDRVAVEVSGTGRAIPAGQLGRILDPFSGTAAPGAGGGLGLSVCRSIVTALGGEIQIETQAGTGTTFRVLFPVARAEDAEPRPDRAAPGAPRRRILVVDDEPLIGTVIERTLGGEFDIVAVGGSRQALELLARGERFDLVFSDLLMPGMTGMDLLHELERLHPALASKVVFLTGGAFTEAARAFLARPGVECVEKPFDIEALRGAIARRLGPG